MAVIVYGNEGDQTIIVRQENEIGITYLVESRAYGGYYTTFASYDFNEVLERVKASNPSFRKELLK